MLAAAAVTWAMPRWAKPAALVMCAILLTWLAIETATVGLQAWEQYSSWCCLGLAGMALVAAGRPGRMV